MKSYDEIANSVFKRRDEYKAKQKKKRSIIINAATTVFCCCIVFVLSFGIWKMSILGGNEPIVGGSQEPSANNSNAFNPSNDISSNSSPSSSSQSSHTNEKPTYFIDSIDKINFYSAKKIINDTSLLPLSAGTDLKFGNGRVTLLTNYVEYPIDRNKVFTSTMVTYFTINLNDERGFLAQKLGGTGKVEVVVTQNDIDFMGEMITFKRGDRYFSCLCNSASNHAQMGKSFSVFSTHKYIDGFNIVKNMQQENYEFTVLYEGSKVVDFTCSPFYSTPTKYTVDNVTLNEDACIAIFTTQTFTIDQLEVLFGGERGIPVL